MPTSNLELNDLGISPNTVRLNWNETRLYERAVADGEAEVA